ncbi:hypothetical protein [Sporolactobacillus terrae]|uniref:Uncharacterized protein n=1 Tax=Sporolactobacillus terrae TaxID=269673 RepID=A0A410DAV8_9BACL|nr:hypothetical protein [Sporolactobacillus terrae]QAA23218.1 hypothetical protein C0674_11635 [Sporolactobacillus terrae]QAA26188.1 hypothetical protein C0679_11615 [Sporolactobacillus terrae]UAK15285.1 hypothetical protein K7399_09285 [Sporolactobacillus terrae]BBN99618.1 hypothetical protein St703_23230 [Sporolactobacillus terrae]
MIRNMYVVQFLNQSAWYLNATLQIQTERQNHQKGDIIEFKNKKYIVIEDYWCLRVRHFNRELNPYKPLITQIQDK